MSKDLMSELAINMIASYQKKFNTPEQKEAYILYDNFVKDGQDHYKEEICVGDYIHDKQKVLFRYEYVYAGNVKEINQCENAIINFCKENNITLIPSDQYISKYHRNPFCLSI